jgi:oligopeptide transport system permease protein
MNDSPNIRSWRRFRRNRLAAAALAYMVLVVFAAIIVPVVSPFPPDRGSELQFTPPDWSHWFGTDVHGRDLFARVFSGARVSLLVGAVGAGVSLVIGVAWGLVAGYAGRRTDVWMMRIVDILYTLPSIVFVIVLMAALEPLAKRSLAFLGPGFGPTLRLLFLFVGLGSISWLTMARIVRGQVLSLRTRAFVLASRTLGVGPVRILTRHILPNVAGVVIVYLTLAVPSIVLYESFLSYLGLGVQPPAASLGTLIAEGALQINPLRVYWWLLAFPGGLLATTLLALSFVGDGLRDAFDPRGG